MFHNFLIVFAFFAGWFLLLWFLRRMNLVPPVQPQGGPGVPREPPEGDTRPLSLMGPFLMLKTRRGRNLIERLSHWRGTRALGYVYVGLVVAAMVGITLLLLLTAYLIASNPPEQGPPAEALLGLPGINPFIPLTYGIFALAVAIIVHEFSHGILARKWNIPIRSLGILLFIVPVGAFVEPDEEKLRAVDRTKRSTVYAAGPGSNVVLAVLMALIFSVGMMGAVQAKAEGMGVTGVVMDGPAEQAGLVRGDIITAIDGLPVPDGTRFRDVLGQFGAGETVTLDLVVEGAPTRQSLTLGDRADFTGLETDRGRSYIGVTTVSTNPDIFNPLASSQRIGLGSALFVYIVLPFQGLSPIQPPLTEFYEVTGPWGAVPPALFWVVANGFYWLFWLNLMLGLTNALPAVPLDGGYLFRDWMEGGIKRVRRGMRAAERERVARNVSYVVALVILALILMPLIVPLF